MTMKRKGKENNLLSCKFLCSIESEINVRRLLHHQSSERDGVDDRREAGNGSAVHSGAVHDWSFHFDGAFGSEHRSLPCVELRNVLQLPNLNTLQNTNKSINQSPYIHNTYLWRWLMWYIRRAQPRPEEAVWLWELPRRFGGSGGGLPLAAGGAPVVVKQVCRRRHRVELWPNPYLLRSEDDSLLTTLTTLFLTPNLISKYHRKQLQLVNHSTIFQLYFLCFNIK